MALSLDSILLSPSIVCCLFLCLPLELTLLSRTTSPFLVSCQTPYSRAGSQSILSLWTFSLFLQASLRPRNDCRLIPLQTSSGFSLLVQSFPRWASLSTNHGLPSLRRPNWPLRASNTPSQELNFLCQTVLPITLVMRLLWF